MTSGKKGGVRAKNTSTASNSEDGKGGREDRASTGIGGLDRLITGGFLRNSLVLVTGQPGTGKTILTSQFVHHGATHGEKSIYASYAENKRQFMSNMKQLGMDFAKLEGEQGTFLFMDFASTGSKEGASDSLKVILEQVSRFKAKRLVIDSYNAAMQGFEGSNEARTTLDVVHKVLNEAKCTTLIVSEAPAGMGTNKLSLEEFVADGVIFMDNIFLEVGQIPRRTLSIRKMRGMPIALNPSTYDITDSGVIVYPSVPGAMPVAISDKRVRTDISGFDDIIGGGLPQGSFTAITGASGTGKTNLSLELAYRCASKQRQKVLFVSYEEPKEQLMLQLRNLGFKNPGNLEKEGLLNVESIPPEQLTPDAHLLLLERLLDKTKAKIAVFDGVIALESICSSDREFYFVMKRLASITKANNVTSVCCMTAHSPAGGPVGGPWGMATGLSTIVDGIIMLQRVELEGEMARFMIIVKMRATSHSNLIRRFEIGRGGVRIKKQVEPFTGILSGIATRMTGAFEAKERGISEAEENSRAKRNTDFRARLNKAAKREGAKINRVRKKDFG